MLSLGQTLLHGYNSSEVRARKRWLGKQKFDIVHAFDMRPSCAKPAFQAKRHGALMFSDWADLFGKGGSVEERANPIARAILRPPVESYNERVLRKKSAWAYLHLQSSLQNGAAAKLS